MQSRKRSALEAATNVVIGCAIGFACQATLIPLLHRFPAWVGYLAVTVSMTIASFVRQYVVRRHYNALPERQVSQNTILPVLYRVRRAIARLERISVGRL